MARTKRTIGQFMHVYLKEEAVYQVHYLFLKRYNKEDWVEIIYKENAKFNSSYFSIEPFYKPINLPITLIKSGGQTQE
jgi:hypothetical protein